MKKPFVAAALVLGAFAGCTVAAAPSTEPAKPDAGRIRLVKRTEPAFDRYTDHPTPALQRWMRDHFWRMVVHSPYFDQRSRWHPGGLLYIDSYAVYRAQPTGGSDVPREHPEWILADVRGNRLYIPWGCDPAAHNCPQYAADFSNAAYRQWWVDRARRELSRGSYAGLWIDDVNMDFRAGDGDGREAAPIDRRTGAPMTIENWRRYMAEFMEKVRRDLPGVEIVHNAIWYAGGKNRAADPFIQRQILAAGLIDIEHGVNDKGLTGGDGLWSFGALLAFIDRVNGLNRHVILDGIAGGDAHDTAALEYAVASYFLTSDGGNALGDGQNVVTPDNYWPGLRVSLGAPTSPRYQWNHLWRRDFQSGMVLVNEPGNPERRVSSPAGKSVTLAPARGVVLLP